MSDHLFNVSLIYLSGLNLYSVSGLNRSHSR